MLFRWFHLLVPRVRNVPVMHCRMEPWWDVPPPSLCRILGDAYAARLTQWWCQIVDKENQPLRWVSFAQLYIHFQMAMSHPGLVRCSRKWSDPLENPALLPEQVAFRTRAKWFRLQVQQLWKCCGWSIQTASTRPESDYLVCFLGSAAMPIKSSCLQSIERWLMAKTTPIHGHGQSLDALPPAW